MLVFERLPLALLALVFWSSGALAEKSDTERAGDVLAAAIPAAAFGMTFFYEDDREGTIQYAKSLGVTLVTTLALKEITNKERPDGDCCDAFPSGHTSVAFSGATFMHRRYGLK